METLYTISFWILSFLFGVFAARTWFSYNYTVVDESEYETPKRYAVIKKIGDGKFFVYDKESGVYLCQFVSWSRLPEQLGEWDDTVNWMVEHNIPELDKKNLV